SCQGPSISFPRPQYFTPHGFSRPFWRRSCAKWVLPGSLQYSTHLRASSTDPKAHEEHPPTDDGRERLHDAGRVRGSDDAERPDRSDVLIRDRLHEVS